MGESFVYTVKNGDGVSVVDIPAQQPVLGVLVVHAPMLSPLDAAQRYQLATIAMANPEYRVIGFGNPARGKHFVTAQELDFWSRLKVALLKDMRPIITPELAYLESQGITEWHQIGFSYGALKATTESEHMRPGALQGLLLLDPVPFKRNIVRLGLDFKKTYGPLGKYVNAVNLETYHKARGDAAREFGKNALFRPVNIAISFALSRINIYKLLARVMKRHPQASVMIAWGAKSELGNELRTRRSVAALNQGRALKNQAISLRLDGAAHAFANDVHLYAAIIRQFLS